MRILYAILISLCLISGKGVAETADDYFNKGMDAYQKRDFATAAKFWQQACNNKNPFGCDLLGDMYRESQGIKQDYFKAAELYEKACNGGDIMGCTSLGVMYSNGQGVKQDYFKPPSYTKKRATAETSKVALILA